MSLSRATMIECDYCDRSDWSCGTFQESRVYFETVEDWIYTADAQSPRCKTYCSRVCQQAAEKEDKWST